MSKTFDFPIIPEVGDTINFTPELGKGQTQVYECVDGKGMECSDCDIPPALCGVVHCIVPSWRSKKELIYKLKRYE